MITIVGILLALPLGFLGYITYSMIMENEHDRKQYKLEYERRLLDKQTKKKEEELISFEQYNKEKK